MQQPAWVFSIGIFDLEEPARCERSQQRITGKRQAGAALRQLAGTLGRLHIDQLRDIAEKNQAPAGIDKALQPFECRATQGTHTGDDHHIIGHLPYLQRST